jgi:transposase
VLSRCGLRYKRGRHYLHSPDPEYQQRRDRALACVAEARRLPSRTVTLYLDEMSYYRQPTVSRAWAAKGARHQPKARLSYHCNSLRRLVAALDVVTGRVISEQWPKVGVRRLAAFYQVLRQHYPEAESIHLIQDNWPIHFYPQVERAAAAAHVEMVRLPTYAPWLNPVEKLWRKLRQEVLHLHRFSDDWQTLQHRVRAFFESFAHGSEALLRYVGLLPN